MQRQQSGTGLPEVSRHLHPLSQFNDSRPIPHYGTPQQFRTVGADRSQQLAKALGWLSIGLGTVHLLAPRTLSRAIGVADRPMLFRALGLREIASGVGILTQRQPTNWLWSRVAGDAIDLTLLGMAVRRSGADERSKVALACAAVAGVAVLDILSSVQQTQIYSAPTSALQNTRNTVHVQKSITVNKSADECYRFWREFDNFPRFMKHLEEVRVLEGNRSHWKAKAPLGASVEWDAEVTIDQPGRLLAWRSVADADVDNAGTVSFERAPGDRGTVVHVDLQYSPPAGRMGALVAKVLGEEPAQQIDDDLRRFKWLIETGEIPTSIGQPSGPRSMMSRLVFRKGEPG
jgi:uncharacterized membrane protein